MALYRVSLRFAHDATWPQRRKWSNVFYINSPSAIAASAAGAVAWQSWLRPAVNNSVFCYESFASDLLPGTTDYAVTPVPAGAQRGTRNPGAGEKYLLKACAGVQLLVPGSRPSRKFWRLGLIESDVENGVTLLPGLVTALNLAFGNFIEESVPGWQDPDGQNITAVGRITLTTREFGREASVDVPEPPPVG